MGVALDENVLTVSNITVRAIGTDATYLIFLVGVFDAVCVAHAY